MVKDLEKTSRNRSISGGESNNNEELVSMDVEEESEASTASSLNQQQQQRKLWRSKSTVRSQESSLEAATAVTNDELKELKQWFQVKHIKYVTSVQFLYIFCLKKKAFRPAKKELFIISLLFFPSPLCGMLDTAGGKEKTSPDCSNDFLVGAGGGVVVCKRNSDLSRCEVCAADGQFHVGGRARAIWMMRNRLCNCVSTAPNTNKFAPLRHFHGSFDVPQN